MPDDVIDKFPKFRTVKQRTESDCGAAVAAMACGTSFRHARANMTSSVFDGHEYYRAAEVARYLASNNIVMGLHLQVLDRHTLAVDDECSVSWSLDGWPAILSVKSDRIKGADHWLLWDGKQVRDPSPHVGETCRLDRYEVTEIHPLTIINDTGDER
jgi:hypothetical protein